MNSDAIVGHVFGQFQNLNLLALLADLRDGRIASGNWSSDQSLCPVAHGLQDGDAVQLLGYASQAVDLRRACRIAAGHLQTDSLAVQRFIDLWDSDWLGQDWLLRELEQMWAERLDDAEAVQAVLNPTSRRVEEKMAGVYGNRTHLEPDFQTLRRV